MRAPAFLLSLSLSSLSIARADPPPHDPPLSSLIAGVASALIPLAVGGGIAASANIDDTATRRAGLDVIAAGFAVAPFVSHLVAREWRRALLFGALPLACSVGAIAILESDPTVIDTGTTPTRISYGALLAASIVFSTVGLIDSFMAGTRGRPLPLVAQRPTLAAAPLVLPSGGGLALGGRF